ncbi:MAG: hypothetical protein WAM72_16110 [Xanthobacteraceae bacterium]
MPEGKHIRGREATYMAIENDKRRPIALDPAPSGSVDLVSEPRVPAKIDAKSRTAPPRVLKPSRGNDQVCAPTPDLEGHRAALRRVFGTLSEDYSQTMFGKLVAALRPNPFEQLDEATLNAAIALVASMEPKTELEALLAVEIAAIGFAGHKFLRQSQHQLDEVYIGVYGNYAVKLLRLQLDMIQALDRHRRGNTQTVEVRHVHIHSGAQGVAENDTRPHASGRHRATAGEFGQQVVFSPRCHSRHSPPN